MNKSTITALITTAALLFSAEALAKSVEIKETTTENPNQTYTLRVYNSNKTAESDDIADLIYADEAKSDKDRIVTFGFDFNAASGYYPYVITSKSGKWEKTGRLSFVDDDERKNAEAELAAAVISASPGPEVKRVFNKYPGVFQLDDGFDIAADTEKLNTSKAYDKMAKRIKDNLSEDFIKKVYKEEMILVAAQYGDYELIAKVDSEYLPKLCQTDAFITKLYNGFGEKEKLASAKAQKGEYASVEEYGKAHERATAVTAMNVSESWMSLKEIIDNTYKTIGITKPASNDICNKLYLKLPFADTADYEAKLKELSKGSSDDGGKKSTGGGGGGGGGYVNPQPTVKPQQPDETKITFSDIDSVPWAKEAIESFAEKGIISGRDNKTFAPHDTMLREEFVKLIANAFSLASDEKSSFDDVDYSAWYAPFINAAAANGIVKGINENQFGVGKNITRQDAAVIISRAAKLGGEELPEGKFADEASIADYAKGAVASLFKIGAVNGNDEGMFLPEDSITRAEAVKIVYNVLKMQEKDGE